jgi:hypothetical protein
MAAPAADIAVPLVGPADVADAAAEVLRAAGHAGAPMY